MHRENVTFIAPPLSDAIAFLMLFIIMRSNTVLFGGIV